MAFSTADCSFDLPFSDRTTNFTCDQLSTYWAAYASWTKTEQLIDTVINISLFLAGCSAFVSYVLMVIVFRSPYFNGASYIYHKATIVMEIVHMAVMAQAGVQRLLLLDRTTYSYLFYRKILYELWIIGDGMKLSTSILTTFLSMERFVAIWYPRSFYVINRPVVAWFFVAISLLTGASHLGPAFTRRIVRGDLGNNVTGWTVAVISGQSDVNIGGDVILSKLIYGLKLFSCGAMAIFCVGVAIGLILRAKKVNTLSAAAHLRWKDTQRLSILQLVIAIFQIFDHIMWVASNLVKDNGPVPYFLGEDAVARLDFEAAMRVIRYRPIWRYISACQEVTGILDHSTRLPLYLIGMKPFKKRFLRLFCKDSKSAMVVHVVPMAEMNRVKPTTTS